MSESNEEIRPREGLLRLDAHIRFELELTSQRMICLPIAESLIYPPSF